MNSKFTQALIGGIVATVVMTIIMIFAAMLGMPEMKPPMMLSSMLGTSVIVGWIMHFMIGIIFALLYAYVFLPMLRGINSNLGRGAVFGIIAFIIAQIAMFLMGKMMGGMPEMEGSMAMRAIESGLGHIVFGIVVAMFVKDEAVRA